MEDKTIEKTYCYEKPSDNSMLTMLAANGGMNGQWNNPFMYLVWMWMMRGWNGGNGWGGAENETQRQITSLQNQMQDNHNADLIMDGIHGNTNAIREAATRMNCDVNALQMAVNNVRSSIDQVSGQVGFSSERVINAANMGNTQIIMALKDCCCQTQQNIIRQGYESQLANERQTNELTRTLTGVHSQLNERLRDIGNGISQGFASTAYETQRQTCDIINAGHSDTQRIIDTLNSHWKDELGGKLQDAKFEISQLKQNQYLAGIISGNNNGCGGGCGI